MTLSMGATAVLEMAAAIPPARKSLAKEIAVSVIFSQTSLGFACRVEMADSKLEERAFKKTVSQRTSELRLLCLIGWPERVGGASGCPSVQIWLSSSSPKNIMAA